MCVVSELNKLIAAMTDPRKSKDPTDGQKDTDVQRTRADTLHLIIISIQLKLETNTAGGYDGKISHFGGFFFSIISRIMSITVTS